MEYIVKVASYKDSKSLFSSFIRLQQRIQGFEPRFSNLSHSEAQFIGNNDPEVLKRIKKLKKIGYGKKNENVLGNEKRIDNFKELGLWFSSSERDNGTRFKFIEDNKGNWEYHELIVTRQEYLDLLDFYIFINDRKYAWIAIILTQGFKTLWFKSYKNLFCSESVLLGLQEILHIGCGFDAITVNPAKLAWILEKKPSVLDKIKK